MTKVQQLQIKMSEAREKVNGMLEVRDDDAEKLAERRKLLSEIQGMEAELRAALKAEADDTTTEPSAESGESAELREIVGRASVSRIVAGAVSRHSVNDGPERELQEHFGVDGNAIPLRMLMPEHRAAAAFGASPEAPGSSPGIAGQVFGDGVAAFANTRFEDVPAGTRSYPVITTGALGNVGTPAKSAEQAETDAVLSVKELRPTRAQIQFAYAVEDAATFTGVDAGLSENIRAGLRDKLDEQVLNKAAAGLLTTGHSSTPPAPGAATTAAQYMAALAGGVDGRFARNEAQVRLLVGTGANGTFPHMAGLAIADAGRLTDLMGDRLRVSPNIAAYAAHRQDGLVIKGTEGNTVAAVWPGVEILRDPYTRESHGEIRLVGVVLWNFEILRTAGYIRHAFRTS